MTEYRKKWTVTGEVVRYHGLRYQPSSQHEHVSGNIRSSLIVVLHWLTEGVPLTMGQIKAAHNEINRRPSSEEIVWPLLPYNPLDKVNQISCDCQMVTTGMAQNTTK